MSEQLVNYRISSDIKKENRASPNQNIEKSYITQEKIGKFNFIILNDLQKKLEYALNIWLKSLNQW